MKKAADYGTFHHNHRGVFLPIKVTNNNERSYNSHVLAAYNMNVLEL